MIKVKNEKAGQLLSGKFLKDISRDRQLYYMLIPFVLYYILFFYRPMYGIQIAFKDYSVFMGITGSPWVGFKHFKTFFSSPYFFRVVRNTFTINFYSLCTVFPASIVLAVLLNEIKFKKFRTFVQTVSYLPHFISTVVVAGLVVTFLSPSSGIINVLIEKMGGRKQYFLMNPSYFKLIYIIMSGWQSIGFGTIVYTSAISGIDSTLYEAAEVDGAGRFRKAISITVPMILPTISIMLITKLGSMLSLGAEAIILLYQPATYETADVISSFVYRQGIVDRNYSYSAAVGLCNSVISLLLVTISNRISRKLNGSGLW